MESVTRPEADLDSITSLVQSDLRAVERLLREGLRSVVDQIKEVGDHTFGSGGKRIRPLLVLLAGRLCGYQGLRAAQIGVAAEYLHTASLLHDDVVDGSDLRRGRPSVNARFGERTAILVGDFMYARACQMLVEDGSIEILALYSGALREMTEGEVLQLSQSFDPHMTETVYSQIIGRKTASLLAAASGSGAILGGVTRAEARAVYEYGWQLGLAFQLVDDALDYIGLSEELGKLPLADLTEGKVTLPLVVTLKRCSTSEREEIATSLKGLAGGGGCDLAARDRIVACVERCQGVEFTLSRAQERADEACAKIEAFADCEAKEALLDLCMFVVQRKR